MARPSGVWSRRKVSRGRWQGSKLLPLFLLALSLAAAWACCASQGLGDASRAAVGWLRWLKPHNSPAPPPTATEESAEAAAGQEEPELSDSIVITPAIAVLLGAVAMLMWEIIIPSSGPVPSTIIAQLLEVAFGVRKVFQPYKATRRKEAAADLKQKMQEFSRTGPLIRLARTRSPRNSSDLQNEGPVNSRATWSAIQQWKEAEAGAGPRDAMPIAGGCVVFFNSHTVTIEAKGTSVEVSLFRVGDLSEELLVEWSTMDGTAVENVNYEGSYGLAEFAPGEASTSLTVPLIREDVCCTRKFFVVHVERIRGRGTMGSLPFVRVRISFTDPWPGGLPLSQQPSKATAKGHYAKRMALVKAFFLMLMRRRGYKYWHVCWAILWLDFHRVVLNSILLNYALYDICFARAQELSANSRLLAIVGLKLLFVLFDRFADHVKETKFGGAPSTIFLQQQLVHKFIEMQQDAFSLGHFYHLFFNVAPEAIQFAYAPTFKVVHVIATLVFSLTTALGMPILKGNRVRLHDFQPFVGILLLVPTTILVSLTTRRLKFRSLAQQRRDAHIQACDAMQEVLDCRQWVRAYDGAYPSQHVRQAFDEAHLAFGLKNFCYSHYRHDTEWTARYFGELAKAVSVLWGGYAALNTLRTKQGTMTLGRFAVFISIYGALVSALYEFIDAWDGFRYVSTHIRELSAFLNEVKAWEPELTSTAADTTPPSLDKPLSIKLESVVLDVAFQGCRQMSGEASSSPSRLSRNGMGLTAVIPLGCVYGMMAPDGYDGVRRHAGAAIGCVAAPQFGRVDVPSVARALLIAPPVSLAAGSVLENLMSSAAAWVRASDVIALTAAMGLPFAPPAGEHARHGLRASKLISTLNRAIAGAELKTAAATAAAFPASGQRGSARLRNRPAMKQNDLDYVAKKGQSFKDRMSPLGVTVLSSMSQVEVLLRPFELELLNLARGILADPDVLIVQDTLSALPIMAARAVVHILVAWQRLGGFKGLVRAWEDGGETLAAEPSSGEYPWFITETGGLRRTLILSESTLVTTGLSLRGHIDAWLVVGTDDMQISTISEAGAGAAKRAASPRGETTSALANDTPLGVAGGDIACLPDSHLRDLGLAMSPRTALRPGSLSNFGEATASL